MTLSPSGVFSDVPNTITTYSFLMQFEAVDATERYSSSATTSMWPPVAALPALSTSPGELNIEYTIGNPAPVPVPINIGSTASSFAFFCRGHIGPWLLAIGFRRFNPNGTSIAVAGGPGGFNISTTPSCSWSASTPDSWITLTSAGSGSGKGTVNRSSSRLA
jgi:hypothetical protein